MNKTTKNLPTRIGFDPVSCKNIQPDPKLLDLINLQLLALEQPTVGKPEDYPLVSMGRGLIAHYQAKEKLLDNPRCPADARIEAWLERYLSGTGEATPRLPGATLTLNQHGVARTISLPQSGKVFQSDIIESYRLANGVLHNPRSDRRTTKGVFHVAEDGLPIPDDKKAVPSLTFSRMMAAALQAPEDLLRLPLTHGQEQEARTWVSLLLRPVVCPAVPGFTEEKSMEVRFFVPGNLVCNLDFVESIFGNGGDPYLPENDAALDIDHWSGHTGCIILAPHLTRMKKKEMGLPHISEATERLKRDGMCWENEDELYNDGSAFKLTARNAEGVVVTLIADNYFGYCKKEVKTQIGFAANLMGMAEEEHAGGALAFSSYDLGEDFKLNPAIMPEIDHTFAEVVERLGDRLELRPEGYAIDSEFPNVIYVPEDASFTLNDLRISWQNAAGEQSIKLLAEKVYLLPSGYKVQLLKPADGRRWRLIGTRAQPCLTHKPCTVSGGGKSEISKSIADAIIHAPLYVSELPESLDAVEAVLNREYGMRFRDESRNRSEGRPILSPERSLGSVIKLLTPDEEYTDEHNAFVKSIRPEIKQLVLLVKRFYKPDWGEDWRGRFSVDRINAMPGHELRYRGRPVVTSYLRVGYEEDGSWRVFGLRGDFSPARKIQMEDDITASVTVPREALEVDSGGTPNPSLKFIHNCEYRLFQRPDDAIIRGYDKQAESDMAQPGNFFSNYAPLPTAEAREMVEDAVRFDHFTEPMKAFIREVAAGKTDGAHYFACNSNPRVIDGRTTKNPRYLQTRLDLVTPQDTSIAEIGLRLYRRLRMDQPLYTPVDVVCPGRRNNPPEEGIRPLCVFNPIHYLPLPEAFMEFVSSMTGKSPSTTGAGSEGAMTKAPFNALLPVHDLNAALVSFIISGYEPFVTAAGYVGPKFRVDHDISLLVPEIFCRMKRSEREASYLIENGLLERVPDVEHNGHTLPGGILGYRITSSFVNRFMGRIFNNPSLLFTPEMLRPEQQDEAVFIDGMENILATHQRVAQHYFNDGSIDQAIPPLRALLHIMRDGQFQGKTLEDDEIRDLFTRETVMQSDWYSDRLDAQQSGNLARLARMERWLERSHYAEDILAGPRQRLAQMRQLYSSDAYRQSLHGSIGRDPCLS